MGPVNGVRVAPSVVEEGKEKLQCRLLGFLKSKKDCLQQTEFWINSVGGRVLVHLSLPNESTVWMLFVSEQEAEEVMLYARARLFNLPHFLL